MSAINDNNQNSSKKEDGDLAEMEQLLKSGAFPKDLSGTFKQMRQASDQDLANKSQDKLSSNAGISDNFNANSQASPSPGKLIGAEGKIFQKLREPTERTTRIQFTNGRLITNRP